LTTSTRVSPRLPQTVAYHNANKNAHLRQFSISAAWRNVSQEAPNSQNYLNSGAIAGARDLVDVKKVLVIGSGGLAIGQAGEFDYSGQFARCSDVFHQA
jgi:carbamoyl-phosphate synthase large subunit